MSVLVLAALSLAAASEGGPLEDLEVHVWAEGGMQDEVVGDETTLSFVLPMARLQARFRRPSGTGMFVRGLAPAALGGLGDRARGGRDRPHGLRPVAGRMVR